MDSVRLNSDNTLWLIGEPASIEGSFPLPDSAADASAILLVTGCAEITGVSTLKDSVSADGKARFCVLFSRADGTVDSFDAQCGFEHSADLPGAVEGMSAAAVASVMLITHRLEAGALYIAAELCIDLFALSPASCEALLPKDSDCVYDTREGTLVSCITKASRAYIKEELRIPQTLPELQRILCVGGYAVVDSVKTEREKLIAEGGLRLLIAFLSTDKNAPLQFMQETVSFGEITPEPGIGEASCALVSAVPERISAEAEGDVVTVSAALSLAWLAGSAQKAEYIADMYSLTGETELKRCCLPSRLPCFAENVKRTLRFSLTVPETAPEISRVLAARAYPEITSVLPADGKAEAEGLMYIELVYMSPESGLRSITVKQPFDELIPLGAAAGSDVAGIRVHAESAAATGSGREPEVKVCLEFSLFAFDINDFCPVTDAEYTPAAQAESGITVCFADGEESRFDITRRHRVSPGSAVFPDTESDPPERGSRIIMIR